MDFILYLYHHNQRGMNRRHTKLLIYHTRSETLRPTKSVHSTVNFLTTCARPLHIPTEGASQSVYQRLYRSVRRPGRGAECFGISSVDVGLTFILHISSTLTLWCLVAGTTNCGLLPGRNTWRAWILFPNYRTQKAKNSKITPTEPGGYYMYHQFNIHHFYVQPTHFICVFCVDLSTNSDYFPIQH